MRRWIAQVSVVAVFVACSSDSSTPNETGNQERHIEVQAGATQAGVMGQPAPVAPAVKVTDGNGSPVAGVVVTFSIASGGGSVSNTTATTNTSGVASVSWTLGKTFATQALDASASGIGSVGFQATAIGPDGGILAFEVTDPAGDTLAYAGAPQPRALDLIGLRGDFKRDSLILTLTFSSPVSDAALGGPTGLYGLVEFDIDDRFTTGFPPESRDFGSNANLGIDYLLDLFDEGGLRKSVLYSETTTDIVPSTISGNTAVVRIPMRLLGSDDGNFSIVGVLGLIDRATDLMPNSGAILARP